MFRRNRWFGGRVKLIAPPLHPALVGQSCAVLRSVVFDPKVGQEVVLYLLDDPDFSRQLGRLKPFHLVARTGAVRTSAGLIAFILWTVSSRRGHVVDYEHPLNPFEMGTIRLLSAAGQQSHLKVVILDSHQDEVVGFFEFENTFSLDRLAAGVAEVIGHEPTADFAATQAALRMEFSLEDLKNA